MATSRSNTSDADLRKEFEELSKQVSELVTLLKTKGEEHSSRLSEKLESGLEDYHKKAEKQLHDAYELGNEQLEELGGHIRRNPVTSLLIAFGAGYVLSKLMGADK